MAIWIFIAIVAFVKLPIAAVMLWYPFRNERVAAGEVAPPAEDQADEGLGGGGSPNPRRPAPRRGPHGEPLPLSPPRIRFRRPLRERLAARR